MNARAAKELRAALLNLQIETPNIRKLIHYLNYAIVYDDGRRTVEQVGRYFGRSKQRVSQILRSINIKRTS